MVNNFPESTRSKAENPGEFIHTDVGGPKNVLTPRGLEYFFFSKIILVVFEKYTSSNKNQEYAKKSKSLRRWKKRQTGNSIKSLRSDYGTEYLNREMADFLRNNGKSSFKVL